MKGKIIAPKPRKVTSRPVRNSTMEPIIDLHLFNDLKSNFLVQDSRSRKVDLEASDLHESIEDEMAKLSVRSEILSIVSGNSLSSFSVENSCEFDQRPSDSPVISRSINPFHKNISNLEEECDEKDEYMNIRTGLIL